MSVLFVLFILVPIAELFLIIKVGAFLGISSTLAILILDSFIGAWLVKRQGLSLIRRAKVRMSEGEMPGDELVTGLAVLVAGALMLTPGFLTDAIGMALLISPIRSVVIKLLKRKFQGRLGGTINTQENRPTPPSNFNSELNQFDLRGEEE